MRPRDIRREGGISKESRVKESNRIEQSRAVGQWNERSRQLEAFQLTESGVRSQAGRGTQGDDTAIHPPGGTAHCNAAYQH